MKIATMLTSLRSRLVPAAAAWLLAALPLPAAAQERSALPDVPRGHWAAAAVDDVAVTHRLMPLFKDGSFHGDAVFTRLDFAKTMAGFINEMETTTGTSLADSSFSFYAFSDVDEAADRAIVEPIANQYNLFDGVPGLSATTFLPKRPVTRYELAAVFDKLFRLAEKKRLIAPPRAREMINPFIDMRQLDFAYQAVLNTVLRYQVLSGFPDATFRGNLELTRYQFAAAAAKSFALIREQSTGVVRQRLPRGQLEGLAYTKFHGDDSIEATVYALAAPAIDNRLLAPPAALPAAPIPITTGALLIALRGYGYPPAGATETYRDWAYTDSAFTSSELEILAFPSTGNPLGAAVGGRDHALLGIYSQRYGVNERNAEPFHIQSWLGWYAFPAISVGPGALTDGGYSGFEGGGAAGAGGLAGFAWHYRIADPVAFSVVMELGAGPFGGFRVNSTNSYNSVTQETTTDTKDEPGPYGGVLPSHPVYGGQVFSRFMLSFQVFARPTSVGHLDILVTALPGGFQDVAMRQNPDLPDLADKPRLDPRYFAVTPLAGVGFGWNWK